MSGLLYGHFQRSDRPPGRSPSGHSSRTPTNSDLNVRLWDGLPGRPTTLQLRAHDGAVSVFGPDNATLWHEGGLHRVVGGREVRIEPAPGGVDVEPLDEEVRPVVLTLLGAAFDLDAFRPTDPLVARQARLRGFRPPLAPDPFEMLVGAISAQQISLRAALAVRNRFVERFGVRAELAYAFPLPDRVAEASRDELTALGFSGRKADYISLARSDLDYGALAMLPDDEVKAMLVQLPGIGEWTADWFLAATSRAPAPGLATSRSARSSPSSMVTAAH